MSRHIQQLELTSRNNTHREGRICVSPRPKTLKRPTPKARTLGEETGQVHKTLTKVRHGSKPSQSSKVVRVCTRTRPRAGTEPLKIMYADGEEGIVCSFRGTARLLPASSRRVSTSIPPAKRGVPSTDGSELFRRLWKGTIRALLQASPGSAARLAKGSANAPCSRRPRTWSSSASLQGTARAATSPGGEGAAACQQHHHRVLLRSVVR